MICTKIILRQALTVLGHAGICLSYTTSWKYLLQLTAEARYDHLVRSGFWVWIFDNVNLQQKSDTNVKVNMCMQTCTCMYMYEIVHIHDIVLMIILHV